MSEAPPITRDPDLWFEDGNLVIQVTPRLFRLHRGILAAHSNFFRNMADFPASQEQSTYDGVPLVILHDDNALDAGHLFKAIYIFDYFSSPPARVTSEAIEGVLRLAHKYDALSLRRCALRHLSVTCVTELDKLTSTPDRTYPDPHSMLPEMKTIIGLAHEVQAEWLLPMAYYHASANYSAKGLDRTEEWLHRPRLLPHDDVLNCVTGIAALRREFPLFMFTKTTLGCKTDVCPRKRLKGFSSEDLRDFEAGPLTYFTAWVNGTLDGDAKSDLDDLCNVCLLDLRARYNAWLEVVWNRFPSMFDLPDWEKLRQAKQRDLEPEVSRAKSLDYAQRHSIE
ncbi:hypothetical protein EV121DRAFT_193714 [Schizophyllum commune]